MPELLIVDLPPVHGTIHGAWSNGYPVHRGRTPASENYATVYAHEHRIRPDQAVLRREHAAFKATLQQAGFTLTALPFPAALNQPNHVHHDALFIRDAGLMIGDRWVVARFSATSRQPEAAAHARVLHDRFAKQLTTLPVGAYLEFGEVFVLTTARGRYYFGGLGRSNATGHQFLRSLVGPDHFLLIESEGYHLDTVCAPVVSATNELCAFLVATDMIASQSLRELKALGAELIHVDRADASGTGERLGSYAVNALTAPGVLVNSTSFRTPGVEERLAALGIQRFSSPLPSFRWAGGSFHCLTTEFE